MFNRLKQFRRIATRYDKTRTSFEAFLSLAAAKIWLPHFTERLSPAMAQIVCKPTIADQPELSVHPMVGT